MEVLDPLAGDIAVLAPWAGLADAAAGMATARTPTTTDTSDAARIVRGRENAR
jgi:hypothetical protein